MVNQSKGPDEAIIIAQVVKQFKQMGGGGGGGCPINIKKLTTSAGTG